MDTLVSTDWLHKHLNEPDLVVLDCSVMTEIADAGPVNSSGYADYLMGHIPGAGFADLTGDLCDQTSRFEFSPPTPDAFCQAMERLGVGDGSRVVLYDTSFSGWAARVWWMLRWIGFDRAAVLNGGFSAWRAEDRPVSTSPPDLPRRALTPHPRPSLIADRDDVRAAIGAEDVCLIDSMPQEMFRGDTSIYCRSGHIPTAINVAGTDLLDERGLLKPDVVLSDMHAIPRNKRVIIYCGGGILASLNAFVMTRIGYADVAVYMASLQEWTLDPANPMMTSA